jgi:hypothetical protein
VTDVEGLQEALLTEPEGDEVAESGEFGLIEVTMQGRPHLIVGQTRIPGDLLGPLQRCLLSIAVVGRATELDDLLETVGGFKG